MSRILKFVSAVILFLIVSGPDFHLKAQIVTNYRYTICSGDTLQGYYLTGIYKDTFTAVGGGDSIRELDLKVAPKIGVAPLPRWFNTGTNGSGGRLPGGSQDLNWQVSTGNINGPYVPAVVMTTRPGSYTTSIWPDCDWISHVPLGSHSGNVDYYYRISFDLPCFDSCGNSFDAPGTFCLTLDFFADNSVYEIYANGVPQSPTMGGAIPFPNPYSHTGFSTANPVSLTLCNNWKKGNNNLTIHIASGAPYAAFLAQASVNTPPPPSPIDADFIPKSVAGIGPGDEGCAPFEVAFENTSVSAADYLWDFGDGSPTTTDPSPTHTYSTPGVYKVKLVATNTLCGFQQDSIVKEIKVYDVIPPNIRLADTLICEVGDAVLNVRVLNPTPNNRFLWGPSAGIIGAADQASVIVNPDYTNTYWVTVWDTIPGLCGVSVTDTMKVTYAPRSLTLYNKDTAVCEGDIVNINGEASSMYAINWTPAAGVSNPKIIKPSITITKSGTYFVTASYPGCPDTTLSIYFDMQHYPIVDIGQDTAICEGDMLFLWSTVTPPRDDYSYLWTATAAGLSNTDQPRPLLQATESGVFELVVSTPAGCVGVDDRLIEIYPANFGDAITDTSFCPPDSVTLWATGGVHYLWTPAFGLSDTTSDRPIARPGETTNYTVYIFDAIGCRDTFEMTLEVHPRAVINLADTIHVFPGEPKYLDPTSNAHYFSWFPHSGLDYHDVANPLASPDVNTRYFVTAMTEQGCKVTDSVDVLVHCSRITVPNVFVPGNGTNGYFRPVKEGISQINKFSIFNRWGVKVYESSGMNAAWDGTFNNEPQPIGVYVYLLDAVNSCGEQIVKQGNVTLLR